MIGELGECLRRELTIRWRNNNLLESRRNLFCFNQYAGTPPTHRNRRGIFESAHQVPFVVVVIMTCWILCSETVSACGCCHKPVCASSCSCSFVNRCHFHCHTWIISKCMLVNLYSLNHFRRYIDSCNFNVIHILFDQRDKQMNRGANWNRRAFSI